MPSSPYTQRDNVPGNSDSGCSCRTGYKSGVGEKCKDCAFKYSHQPDQNSLYCKSGDCRVGVWTDWGVCTTTCGPGFKERTRPILQQNGGKSCEATHQEMTCGNVECVFEPDIDCVVTEWNNWGSCSQSCMHMQETCRHTSMQARTLVHRHMRGWVRRKGGRERGKGGKTGKEVEEEKERACERACACMRACTGHVYRHVHIHVCGACLWSLRSIMILCVSIFVLGHAYGRTDG